MIIRTIRESDAEQFLSLCNKLATETQYMMLEPGERTTTPEEQRAQIEQLLQHMNQTVFVAENDEQLVGYLAAIGGEFKRNRQCAHIIIGILQAFTGQGIGTKLFQSLEEWAHQQHMHRLELTVMAHNKAGVALYKKQGFEIEGTKRHSLLVNGHFVDEYYMAKLLD
jgi:RimJ/RimL family protein N-acetyltransferase